MAVVTVIFLVVGMFIAVTVAYKEICIDRKLGLLSSLTFLKDRTTLWHERTSQIAANDIPFKGLEPRLAQPANS